MYQSIPDNIKCVYFIISSHFMKIGVASQLRTRFKAISTDCPEGANLFGYIPTNFRFELEQELHEKFKDYHYRGEWFFLCDSLKKSVCLLDNFVPYSKSAKSLCGIQDINFFAAELIECVRRENNGTINPM